MIIRKSQVIAFYHNRILVMELKDRPVNLNDAYKLSAKTLRIESIFNQSVRGNTASRRVFFSGDTRIIHGQIPEQQRAMPIIISTNDIAQDAKDLLGETRSESSFIEMCEKNLNDSLEKIIGDINNLDMLNRFSRLVTEADTDSISSFGAAILPFSLRSWYNFQTNTHLS